MILQPAASFFAKEFRTIGSEELFTKHCFAYCSLKTSHRNCHNRSNLYSLGQFKQGVLRNYTVCGMRTVLTHFVRWRAARSLGSRVFVVRYFLWVKTKGSEKEKQIKESLNYLQVLNFLRGRRIGNQHGGFVEARCFIKARWRVDGQGFEVGVGRGRSEDQAPLQ